MAVNRPGVLQLVGKQELLSEFWVLLTYHFAVLYFLVLDDRFYFGLFQEPDSNEDITAAGFLACKIMLELKG